MLADTIKNDMTAALRAGDAFRTSVLRMVMSELNYKKIEVQRELTDADVVVVLQKEAKKRKESVESYTAGGRAEQAESEGRELLILNEYLPASLSEDEIREELGKMGLPNDYPSAMKLAAPAMKGRADGSIVAKIVKEMIS